MGLQAKDFLRKLLIGKQVRIEHEYDRTVNEKPMQFCSVFLDEKNVNLTMVEKALGQVILGKDKSHYIKSMLEAQDVNREKNVGVFRESQAVRLIDYTGDHAGKAKQAWSFMEKEKRHNAVVEHVINGQKLRVRLTDSNEMIMLQVNGVKTYLNDPNIKLHSKYSDLALNFTKQHILQRDVVVQLDDCDKNGTFHGSVFHQKQNFALKLLQEGFAYCSFQGRGGSYNSNDYQKAEQAAKEAKKGAWSEQALRTRDSEQAKSLQENKKIDVLCTEIISSNEFYLQGCKNKQFNQIQDELSAFNPKKAELLTFPAKKGTPCIAEFDGSWYRAKIVGTPRLETCKVFFMDFGNTDEAYLDSIYKMPQSLIQFPDQARKCAFAYIKTPSQKHRLAEQVDEFLIQTIMEQELKAQFISKFQDTFEVLIEWDKEYLNETLLRAGKAKLSQNVKLPDELAHWRQTHAQASEKKLGMWKFDDEEEAF